MALNLSGFLQNLNSNQVSNSQNIHNTDTSESTQASGTASSSQASSGAGEVAATPSNDAGLKMLRDMLAGETFTGSIKSMNGDQVLLQLSSGETVAARLTNTASLHLSQNITFMIEKNTQNSVLLKPLETGQQQNIMIGNALDAAGLSYQNENIAMVKELLNLSMPIDAKTLGTMLKNSLAFPETSLSTIANLMKYEIPVTESNIHQFEAYQNYAHDLSGDIDQLSGQLGNALSELSGNTSVEDSMQFLNTIMKQLYTGLSETTNHPDTIAANGNAQAQIVSDGATGSYGDTLLSQIMSPSDMQALSDSLNAILPGDSALKNNLLNQLQQPDTTVSEFLKQLSDLQGNMQSNGDLSGLDQSLQGKITLRESLWAGVKPEQLQQLLTTRGFQNILKQAFSDTMKLKPSDVSEDGINNYYKRIRSNLEHIAEEVDKQLPQSDLSKSMSEIKSNIDFMNDLNKNMTYFQMPVKFSKSEGNGELYVFTNKKALKNQTDQISALLHLDMDHLGPMDVYVRLAGKNITTDFRLESEDMLDFIYAHIYQLNDRLESLGYTTKFEMKVNEPEKDHMDFVDDFLHREIPNATNAQYLFDTKA